MVDISRLMRERRHLAPGSDDFSVMEPQEVADTVPASPSSDRVARRGGGD